MLKNHRGALEGSLGKSLKSIGQTEKVIKGNDNSMLGLEAVEAPFPRDFSDSSCLYVRFVRPSSLGLTARVLREGRYVMHDRSLPRYRLLPATGTNSSAGINDAARETPNSRGGRRS